MNLPLEVLAALFLAGQQITENLLGPSVKGHWMRVAAIGITVGLTYLAWALEVEGLKGLPGEKVAMLGVLAGLGSNVFHAVLKKVAPSNTAAPLVTLLDFLRPPSPPPPAPPASPLPPNL
jgi:hypothetical protein